MSNPANDPLTAAGLAAVPFKPDMDMLGAALRAGAETPAEAFAIWLAMIAASERTEADQSTPP